MESAVKRTQLIWIGLLLAAFMYVVLPEFLHPAVRPISSAFVVAMSSMVVATIVIMVLLRKQFVEKSVEILRTQTNNAAAAQRWMTGQLVTYALAESIVLYGLVLRFVGLPTATAIPFYLVGIGAMIVFRPKRIE